MAFSLSLQTFRFEDQIISLYVPNEAEVKTAYEQGKLSSPFWTQVWPAAQALASFLSANPVLTQNKKVVEIGGGLGLPSLVAARNARSVLCTDYITEAVETAQQSADYHRLQNFQTAVLDWYQLPDNLEADVVLLSDINYEPDAFTSLKNMIASFLQKGATIILATPQRLTAKDFITPLLNFCTKQEEKEIMHQGNLVKATVMVLQDAVSSEDK